MKMWHRLTTEGWKKSWEWNKITAKSVWMNKMWQKMQTSYTEMNKIINPATKKLQMTMRHLQEQRSKVKPRRTSVVTCGMTKKMITIKSHTHTKQGSKVRGKTMHLATWNTYKQYNFDPCGLCSLWVFQHFSQSMDRDFIIWNSGAQSKEGQLGAALSRKTLLFKSVLHSSWWCINLKSGCHK